MIIVTQLTVGDIQNALVINYRDAHLMQIPSQGPEGHTERMPSDITGLSEDDESGGIRWKGIRRLAHKGRHDSSSSLVWEGLRKTVTLTT